MKSPEIVLQILLKEIFMKEFHEGKLCASDMIIWYDNDSIENLFNKWLKDKGYSE